MPVVAPVMMFGMTAIMSVVMFPVFFVMLPMFVPVIMVAFIVPVMNYIAVRIIAVVVARIAEIESNTDAEITGFGRVGSKGQHQS
jgi:hypothetical protein